MKFLTVSRLTGAIALTAFSVLLFSCQKEDNLQNPDTIPENEAALYADEAARADASFDDLDAISQVAAEEDNNAVDEAGRGYFPLFVSLRAIIGQCADISVLPVDGSFPKTITIDFKDSCIGVDGKVRAGKILITLSAPRRQTGSVATIKLVNYSVNRVKLEGTNTVTNSSTAAGIHFTVKVTGGKGTFPNGHGYSIEALKTKVQVAGGLTPAVVDNIYQITGRAVVTFNNGVKVTIETTDPVIKKALCYWRSDGTLKVVINDNFRMDMDYGFPNNGACDNKALLTWNAGASQKIILLP